MDPDQQIPSESTRLLTNKLNDTAKNWLAMDGLWFQAVEDTYGMDAALSLDRQVWEQFSIIEARRIIELLGLPERGGLDALERALSHRMYARLNDQEIRRDGAGALVLTMKSCRVQQARERRKLAVFPCKSVGIVEYSVFAKAIDDRIITECRSCPPDTMPGLPYCSWKFTLPGDAGAGKSREQFPGA